VVIRPIRPDDKERLAAGLQNLSQETIRRRFLAAKPRFSSWELRYLTEVDGIGHVALVVIDAEDPDALLGVARFVRLPDDPQTAEWAIVIADHLQGRGLGRTLITQLADEARRLGIERFTATMLEENKAAQRLLDHVSARLERDEHRDGLREVVVSLAA
jgi:RimJ/RimL family protein N-acetyltransferase